MFVLGRPTAYHHTGDEAKCSAYLPFARKKLESLFVRAPAMCRRQNFRLEGVDITIIAANSVGKIIIAAGGEYLDSGWYNHHTTAYLNELAFHPSTVVYGTEQAGGGIQGALTISKGVVHGETLLDNRGSKPMGLKKALVKTSPNGFVSGTAIYADDPTLLKRKAIQSLIRPSNYCGLTQLYVQCLYGSVAGQTQYDVAGMDDTGAVTLSGAPALRVKAGKDSKGSQLWADLRFAGTYAPWVVCRNWRYWLVTVKSGTATFRRINTILSNSSSALASLSLDQRKIHSAMLAGSTLSSTVLTFSCANVVGETLAYGWKPDVAGTTAVTVTHEDVTSPAYRRRARQYEVHVLFDQTGTPSGLDVVEASVSDWDITPGSHALWVPNYADGVETAVAPTDPNFAHWGGVACYAPIYVSVDYSGEAANFTLHSITGVNSFGGAAGFDSNKGVSKNYSSGVDNSEAVVGTGDNGIPGKPYTIPNYMPQVEGLPPNPNTDHYTDERIYWPANPAYPCNGAPFLDPTSIIVTYYDFNILEFTTVTYAGGSDTYTALFGIPFDDASAYFSGHASYSVRNDGTVSTSYQNSYPLSQQYWAYYGICPAPDPMPPDPYGPGGLGIVYDYVDAGSIYGDPMFGGGIGNGPLPPPTDEVYGVRYTDTNATLTLHTGGSTVLLHSWAGSVPNDAPGFFYTYFVPEIGPTGDPNIQSFNVWESIGNQYQYSGSMAEAGSSGWPAGAYNPIGWA